MNCLIVFIFKYWRKHKKSLAALLFSGVLLCAVVCCAFLTLRQEYVRGLDQSYDRSGRYEFMITAEYQDVINNLMDKDTKTGKMAVMGLMGVGELQYQYGTLDDPHNLSHIHMREGRMPQKKGEIAIDSGVLKKFGFFGEVGDTITLDKGKYTIVGIIEGDQEISDVAYGYYRRGSKLVDDEGKQTNLYIEDKSQFDSAYNIPLMFISPEEEQDPKYTLVMLSKIKGLKEPPLDLGRNQTSFYDGEKEVLLNAGLSEEEYDKFALFFRDQTEEAIRAYNFSLRDQIYTKLLIYGAAVIIAVLSVIAVMRNIFIERENTTSMLRRIGMSKRRIRLMYTIEYIFLAAIQSLIGIALGTAVHMGIYEYQVRVLDMTDFSGFSHNDFDRMLCPNPFIISILISAAVLLVGYVLAALMQRMRVPKLKRRKAGSVRRCFAKIFRNRTVTVIQTLSLTLIFFSTIFGYMLFRMSIGSFDPETGEFYTVSNLRFGDNNQFFLDEENVKEYYRTDGLMQNSTELPMVIDPRKFGGVSDDDMERIHDTIARGVIQHTMIISDTLPLPRKVQLSEEQRKFVYDQSSDKGKAFIDGHKNLYKIKTALSDKETIQKLSECVTSGEINIDQIMSGKEIIYVVNHYTPVLKAGDEVKIVSAVTINGFGMERANETFVKIGAVVEIKPELDNMIKYAVSANDDFCLLTTVSGAKSLNLDGTAYTELISRSEIGSLLPMGTNMRVTSLAKRQHEIFVKNASLYGSLGLLILVMSLLGFAAYFNGIGMKIRMKEYQISIMRAIGTPLKKLRRRLMLDSIRIPICAGTVAYGLLKITQRVMLEANNKAESIIKAAEETALDFSSKYTDGTPEYEALYYTVMENNNSAERKASRIRQLFLTDYTMWLNNIIIPTLIVFAVMCMITILLTRKSVGGFGSNIAYSISKGRKRR